ncbi:MAG: hypothetical protein WBE82_05060 [Xanthobacteraceae bacterium]
MAIDAGVQSEYLSSTGWPAAGHIIGPEHLLLGLVDGGGEAGGQRQASRDFQERRPGGVDLTEIVSVGGQRIGRQRNPAERVADHQRTIAGGIARRPSELFQLQQLVDIGILEPHRAVECADVLSSSTRSPTAVLPKASPNSAGRSDFGDLIAASVSRCSAANLSTSVRKAVLCCSGKSAVSSTASAAFIFGRSGTRALASAGDGSFAG